MTRQENLEKITEACIRANSQLEPSDMTRIPHRPIRLADVLNAMWLGEFASNEELVEEQEKVHQLVMMWNLRKDNLNDQDDPTLQFISDIL